MDLYVVHICLFGNWKATSFSKLLFPSQGLTKSFVSFACEFLLDFFSFSQIHPGSPLISNDQMKSHKTMWFVRLLLFAYEFWCFRQQIWTKYPGFKCVRKGLEGGQITGFYGGLLFAFLNVVLFCSLAPIFKTTVCFRMRQNQWIFLYNDTFWTTNSGKRCCLC